MVVSKETRTHYRGVFVIADQAISEGGLVTTNIRILIDGQEMPVSSEDQLRKIGQECMFLADALFNQCTLSKVNGSLHPAAAGLS
jgi:hypothetical protein